MNEQYNLVELGPNEGEALGRVYNDLWILSASQIPAVRSAARASLAHIAQALNGQGLSYRLYTQDLPD